MCFLQKFLIKNKLTPLGYTAQLQFHYSMSQHKYIKIKSTLQLKGWGGGFFCFDGAFKHMTNGFQWSPVWPQEGVCLRGHGCQVSWVREMRNRGTPSGCNTKQTVGEKMRSHTCQLSVQPPPLRLCHPACPLLRRHI